jgi:hypothetical protein
MVTIRQHGDDQALFDMHRFLADIDKFVSVDSWDIKILWCTGENALEIEERSASGLVLTDQAFRNLYRGIQQTIDGDFIGLSSGRKVIELSAFDSTFWEVSGPPEFEAHMLSTYGAWKPTPDAAVAMPSHP